MKTPKELAEALTEDDFRKYASPEFSNERRRKLISAIEFEIALEMRDHRVVYERHQDRDEQIQQRKDGFENSHDVEAGNEIWDLELENKDEEATMQVILDFLENLKQAQICLEETLAEEPESSSCNPPPPIDFFPTD